MAEKTRPQMVPRSTRRTSDDAEYLSFWKGSRRGRASLELRQGLRSARPDRNPGRGGEGGSVNGLFHHGYTGILIFVGGKI